MFVLNRISSCKVFFLFHFSSFALYAETRMRFYLFAKIITRLLHRFVPESFRWYVGHNRMKDAENVIKKVARINGKSAPESSKIHSIDMVVSDRRDKKYTLLDVVRSKYLRQYTLLLIPCW